MPKFKKLFSSQGKAAFVFPFSIFYTLKKIHMLKHITISLFVIWTSAAWAQNVLTSANSTEVPTFDFQVQEEIRQMERANANAFVLSYPIANLKTVSQSWKKYAKGLGGKLTYDRRLNEYFVDNGEVNELSENKVDITAKLYEVNGKTEIAIWFNMGVTYLKSSEYPERYQAAEKLLRDFDSFVYAELLRSQIKEEEKQLRKMKRDLKKIERDRKREQKNIERAQRDIEKAQKTIDASEQEIEGYNKTLDEKKTLESRQTELIKQMKDKIKKVR